MSNVQLAFEQSEQRIYAASDSKVMSFVRPWVVDFERDHSWPDMGHVAFREQVYNHLSSTYHWRSWLVGSYSGKTNGWGPHTVYYTSNTVYEFRTDHGRSYFVSLATQNSNYYTYCLDKTISRPYGKCRDILKQVNDCSGGYSTLYCVRDGYGLAADWTSPQVKGSHRCMPDGDCYWLFMAV